MCAAYGWPEERLDFQSLITYASILSASVPRSAALSFSNMKTVFKPRGTTMAENGLDDVYTMLYKRLGRGRGPPESEEAWKWSRFHMMNRECRSQLDWDLLKIMTLTFFLLLRINELSTIKRTVHSVTSVASFTIPQAKSDKMGKGVKIDLCCSCQDARCLNMDIEMCPIHVCDDEELARLKSHKYKDTISRFDALCIRAGIISSEPDLRQDGTKRTFYEKRGGTSSALRSNEGRKKRRIHSKNIR